VHTTFLLAGKVEGLVLNQFAMKVSMNTIRNRLPGACWWITSVEVKG